MSSLRCAWMVFGVALGLMSGPASAQADKAVFRAGAATSNITPPLGLPIVGGFTPAPSRHVHDDLHARCLVLDDGSTKLVFVVCDLLGMSREIADKAKEIISEATGIAPSHVMISGTHTHSASSARGAAEPDPETIMSDYRQMVIRRIADGVVRAVNHLEPAQIGWGVAEEPTQVHNRRWFLTPGSPDLVNPFGEIDKVKMNASRDLERPAGPTDPQIVFLSVRSTEGRPIALLANYSLHYVGGREAGAISADYFAMFADRMQELLGADRQSPPFVGIMSNGTSGDINNTDRGKPGPARRFEPFEKMRYVANLCADAVMKAHESVEFRDHVTLGAVQRHLMLGTRRPTPQQVAWASGILAKKIEPAHKLSPNYASRTMSLANAAETELEIILQAFRVGEVGVTAIPFEVLVEIGLEIKERSVLRPTFTVSLANGSHGYLPTPEQHKLGGYETWLGTSRVEIDSSRKITEALLEMLGSLAR